MPSILFDTTIISGLAKRDLDPLEVQAAAQITQWARRSEVTVGATTVSRDELNEIPIEHREPHDEVYDALMVFKTGSAVTYLDPNTSSVVTNPVYHLLRGILPDDADAKIVAIGEENGFDYLVTDDQRTMLSRREAVQAICSIKLLRPTEAVSEISTRLSERST